MTFRKIYIASGPLLILLSMVVGCSSPSSRQESGELHKAAELGDLETVRQLIAAGSDVNEQDGMGRTPLFRAVDSDNAEMVILLVQSGADPYILDTTGATPLDHADKNGMRKAYQTMVQLGVQ